MVDFDLNTGQVRGGQVRGGWILRDNHSDTKMWGSGVLGIATLSLKAETK